MKAPFALVLALLSLCPARSPHARAAEVEFPDTYWAITDNDGDAEQMGEIGETLESPSDGKVNVPKAFLPAEDVLSNISPLLEEKFHTFILVNTAETGSSSELVPYQHFRVLVKNSEDAKVFRRDAAGRVVGIREENVHNLTDLPDLVPTSTGTPGHKSIRTFSGIFRLDIADMKAKLNTGKEAGMSFQTYIDFKYSSGRDSGIAIHGTPTKNHKLLGKRRASHGCMRTFPAYAKIIRAHMMSPEMFSADLPAFNNRDILPSLEVQSGASGTKPGIRALMIIFNGYQTESLDI